MLPSRHLRAAVRQRSHRPPAAGEACSGKLDADVIRRNKAITVHMRAGRVGEAERLFDAMPRRSTSTYNAMLAGYASNGRLPVALSLFRSIPRPDTFSYNTLLHALAVSSSLTDARSLFDEMPVKDSVTYNVMISSHANHGLVSLARKYFDLAPEKDAVSWNGMLAAYVRNGRVQEARQLFNSRTEWDAISWNALMAGYVQLGRMAEAQELFDRMPQRDVVSWNTMVSGYARGGDMVEARRMFDMAPVRDVFTWTAVVSGYAQNGMLEDARMVFDAMPERNPVSWNAMVAAYVQRRMMEKAKELFDIMPCRNVASWNTMLTGYAQAGMLDEARAVFDMMPQKDAVSWAAILAAYAQAGFSEETLQLFIKMGRCGEWVNRSAFACLLSTCADIAALECGMQLHGRLIKAGYGLGRFVGNALLAMYFKCGNMEDARNAFEQMEDRDAVSWNTVIAGYARHGFGKEALEVFDMMRATSTKPDDITLVGVLAACSHSGLVEKGISYFYSMHRDFGVTAKPEHYTCMIDLLGRAGRLDEAQGLMKDMPFEPDATMWGALLGASRIHRNSELGKSAAEKIFELEPENAGMYVLLSNIYASSGNWRDVGKMRVMMEDRGVKKVPGFSWMEVQNKVHTFSVGDCVHPEKEKIYAFLEDLDMRMKKAGYVSATEMVLHDVEDEEKEHMLKYHSEKLAVAYGILNIPIGRPIRVIKNLRVCGDCHNAFKYISAIEGRLIILRDSNRFHHFRDGSCSCGDYW
ncbi:pentatricopeptide repeat-containing protein At4g02750-like [Triticum dicoccoides]|uniref:pentatricopeptide repeat-containing protein At4g02750-like n=1 Tax=Triticum dicoccoides TaxID=85692 RepID=UPI00188FB546|nr:pentatricopeptide repeat-containing protein At4g02750-like [Triticum dicoccoides]